MKDKFYFHWFSFTCNLVAAILFTVTVYYNLVNATKVASTNIIIGFIAIFVSFLVYVLTDIVGINLLRKLNRNRNISRTRVICIAILLLIQSALQVFLVYIIYTEIGKMISKSGSLVMPSYYIPIIIWLDSLLVILFLTALYNLFSIPKLIKKIRINFYEFNNAINKIGTDQLL